MDNKVTKLKKKNSPNVILPYYDGPYSFKQKYFTPKSCGEQGLSIASRRSRTFVSSSS
jgi:hypothetical protein